VYDDASLGGPLRRYHSTVLHSLARPALVLALATFGVACATGEDDTGGSGLSAGNQSGGGSGTDTSGDVSGSGSTSNSSNSGNSSETSTDPTAPTDPTDPTDTTDPTASTTDDTSGPGCIDGDGDGYGENCDLGPDCDDDDYNNYSDEGCANCMDADADTIWAGCDQYDEEKQGPDCDDDNDAVGLGDAVELCNGIAENCAGEIDPLPPEEMCPSAGDPPNVSSWVCEPPEPGVDGCKINGCDEQFFDVNASAEDGCECQGTDRTKSIDSCGDAAPGVLGTIAEGAVAQNLVVGVIPTLDNGKGNGAEDWYSVEFPQGTRPTSGTIKVSFAQNENSDYRFEAYRDCNGAAWEGDLASSCDDDPPTVEWTFDDTGPANAKYSNKVTWPSKVYLRVFRIQSDNSCSKYQLKVERLND